MLSLKRSLMIGIRRRDMNKQPAEFNASFHFHTENAFAYIWAIMVRKDSISNGFRIFALTKFNAHNVDFNM